LRKHFLQMIVLLVSLGLALPQLTVEANGHDKHHHHCNWHAVAELKGGMRKLWIDHVMWTRDYVKSSVAGLEDQEKVLARLMKNQEDIGNAIKPYYGEEAGKQLTALLKEHIAIAGKLVEAAKTGDQANFNKYNKEWYKNADDIVGFLSKANPNYDKKELKDALYMHLKFVSDQVTARLKKDWDADISAYDLGEDHMIKFADTLARGIKKQFPDKFQCKNGMKPRK
jgi:hypothetical protein